MLLLKTSIYAIALSRKRIEARHAGLGDFVTVHFIVISTEGRNLYD
jgi:hypothetical protein